MFGVTCSAIAGWFSLSNRSLNPHSLRLASMNRPSITAIRSSAIGRSIWPKKHSGSTAVSQPNRSGAIATSQAAVTRSCGRARPSGPTSRARTLSLLNPSATIHAAVRYSPKEACAKPSRLGPIEANNPVERASFTAFSVTSTELLDVGSKPMAISAINKSSEPTSSRRPVQTAADRPNVSPAATLRAIAIRSSMVFEPVSPESRRLTLISSASDCVPCSYSAAARSGNVPSLWNDLASMRSVCGRDAKAEALALSTARRNASGSSHSSAAISRASSRRRGSNPTILKSVKEALSVSSSSRDHPKVRLAIRSMRRSVGQPRMALARIRPKFEIRSLASSKPSRTSASSAEPALHCSMEGLRTTSLTRSSSDP
jgi:hypothetical protein